MKLQLRFAEKYGAGLCGSAVTVTLPQGLVAGKVSDLAAFLAQGLSNGESTGHLRVTGFFVDGFALPYTEAISAVLRETDEVLVSLQQLPQLCQAPTEGAEVAERLKVAQEQARRADARASELEARVNAHAEKAKLAQEQAKRADARASELEAHAKADADRAKLAQDQARRANARASELEVLAKADAQKAKLAQDQAKRADARASELEALAKADAKQAKTSQEQANPASARVAELEKLAMTQVKLAQAQAKKLAKLERQVRELSQQLGVARKDLSDITRQEADGSATVAVEAPSKKRCLDNSEVSWDPVDSAAGLHPGDVLRYHIILVDPWRGTASRSPERTASVAKLLPAEDGVGASVVLALEDGAVDCVEMSQLRGLRVRRRIH